MKRLLQRVAGRMFGRMAAVKTSRLLLEAITSEMMAAEAAGDAAKLSNLLRAEITTEWPPEHWEPHVFAFITKQFEDEPRTLGWHRYVLLPEGRKRTLIGCVGGFPKENGDVEIGYSTLPQFQRNGYATEAAKTMVEWLLRREGVTSISAQTFPRLPESIKVMERCGMSFVGAGDEEGTVRYRRERIA